MRECLTSTKKSLEIIPRTDRKLLPEKTLKLLLDFFQYFNSSTRCQGSALCLMNCFLFCPGSLHSLFQIPTELLIQVYLVSLVETCIVSQLKYCKASLLFLNKKENLFWRLKKHLLILGKLWFGYFEALQIFIGKLLKFHMLLLTSYSC